MGASGFSGFSGGQGFNVDIGDIFGDIFGFGGLVEEKAKRIKQILQSHSQMQHQV